MDPSQFQTVNFTGSVILKEWVRDLKDRQVQRITGVCTLVRDEDYVGFKTRGTEANWGIRVVGKGQEWTVLGCQIRAVVAHELDANVVGESALNLF